MSEYIYLSSMFFIFGALFGSFANVVIYRTQIGLSVVAPGSFCPQCKSKIPLYLNIPILGWFILKGKCYYCKNKISFRYPLVEFITGALFLFAFQKLGLQFSLIEILMLIYGLIIISFIDIDSYLIPDKFTYPGMVLGLIGAILNPDRTFIDGILGLFLGGGFFWSIAVLYYKFKKEEGMGGGDIKLMAWIGAVLGWKCIPFIVLFSSLLGSLIGFAMIMKNKENVKKVIPFGPYISLATILYIFFGEEITNWYLSFFFPWS